MTSRPSGSQRAEQTPRRDPPTQSTGAGRPVTPLRPFDAALEAAEQPVAPGAEAFAGQRGYVLRRLLAVSDLFALCCSFAVMVAIRVLIERYPFIPVSIELFALLVPLWIALGTLLKIYHVGDRSLDYSVSDQVGPVFLVATVWNWAFLLTRAATSSGPVEVMPAITLWAASIVLVLAFRVVTIWLSRGRPWYRQRVLVIGSLADTTRVVRRILRHPEYGLDVVAVANLDGAGDDRRLSIDLQSAPSDERRLEAKASGPAELVAIAAQVRASRVIVATAPENLETRSELIRGLIESGVQVDVVSGDLDLCSSNAAALHYVEGLPVLTVPSVRVARSWRAVKRSIDITAAALGLILLSPVLVFCALGIKLSSPGPVLFRQRRVGRNGETFELLKFRTMVQEADAIKRDVAGLNMHAAGESQAGMFKVPNDPRIIRFGAFLRRWSFDELPQLWNVLEGEMSLVGPRPLIPEEAELIKGRYEARLNMRPGITGPWQTLGRSDIGFEDMVKLDYTYVMNWTLAEDLKLLVRTIGAVVHARGAY